MHTSLNIFDEIALQLRVQGNMIAAVHRYCGDTQPTHSKIIEALFAAGYMGFEINKNLGFVERHFETLAAERAARRDAA